MTSHPVIQCELSETENEFIDWVESQARTQGGDEGAIRFRVASSGTAEAVLVERHAVEFIGLGRDEADVAVGHIAHTMKRIEYRQGRCWFIESWFELSGPDIPAGRAHHRDVETTVKARLGRMKAERTRSERGSAG